MFRRIKRRSLCLILLAGSFIYLLCMLFVYEYLDKNADAPHWMKPFFDPFEIADRRRQCSISQYVESRVSPYVRPVLSTVADKSACMVSEGQTVADIQMDTEWERISVGYPQMVLSVTGWVDTIQVDSWSLRPLYVIVVPFSHQDPGWRNTYDGYYISFTKSTLSLIVSQLTKNPHWKFVWSEIVFLERWWNEATPGQKEEMKKIIQNGQLEILGGGWVMPDEASTHYAALLDEMTEGHLWIADALGVTVNTTWAIDPFGHSSTMAYMNREAGIKNMLIQRTHFAVKRHFAKHNFLEFFWQQPWRHVDKPVFCHMTPFLLYSISHSCGPDRHACCQFDFHRGLCFKGTKKTRPLNLTDKNLPQLAFELWNQLRKKSELYQSDVVLMPHGDDFRYNIEREWEEQLANLDKLIKFINGREEMQMKMEYGTMSDYFKKVYTSKTGPEHQKYPSLSGDFFPYSDRGDQYWSGHYTTRPFLKRVARILQSKLRSAEILFVIAQARKLVPIQNTTYIYETLTALRRTLALFQHHDAITGTSKKSVVQDYTNRLFEAMRNVQKIQGTLLNMSLSRPGMMLETIQPIDIWLNVNDNLMKQTIDVKTIRYLIVNNPLFHWCHKVVSVHVNSVYVTVLRDGKRVKMQLSPTFYGNSTVKSRQYVLSFEIDVPPVASMIFELKPSDSLDKSRLATVTVYRKPDNSRWFHNFGSFKVMMSTDEEFSICNKNLIAKVSVCDGMLKYVHQDGFIYKSDVHFITYKTGTTYNPLKDKSGAYIFLPDGPAEELSAETVSVLTISGELYTQVRTVYRDIIHHLTVFNISGPESHGILLENLVSIGYTQWDNTELAMRLATDIISDGHQFCTDSNGFQMQRRTTRSKFGIQGNFYPMTTSVLLEDQSTRVTVLTTEAHGVANLASGMLDIILDRRLMQDDWRGLDEGVTDNRPTESSFFLLFERKHQSSNKANPTSCYLSPLATSISTTLENPSFTFMMVTNELPYKIIDMSGVPSLPCGYHVVNLRLLKIRDSLLKEALLILHRRGSDCSFIQLENACKENGIHLSSLFPFMDIVTVKEMSITGVHELRQLNAGDIIDIPAMEIKTYKIAFS